MTAKLWSVWCILFYQHANNGNNHNNNKIHNVWTLIRISAERAMKNISSFVRFDFLFFSLIFFSFWAGIYSFIDKISSTSNCNHLNGWYQYHADMFNGLRPLEAKLEFMYTIYVQSKVPKNLIEIQVIWTLLHINSIVSVFSSAPFFISIKLLTKYILFAHTHWLSISMNACTIHVLSCKYVNILFPPFDSNTLICFFKGRLNAKNLSNLLDRPPDFCISCSLA